MALRAVPDRPLSGVGLVRVSKVGARGDDLLSPDLQRHAIETYAAGRGIEVIQWIEALDESGSQARSPWWRRLDQAVSMVESGQVQAILVWKFSRAARQRLKWAVAIDRVEVAGGVLESATEQLDTTTSTGRLGRGVLAEMAAWESDKIGEQWKEVHAHRRAQGLPHRHYDRIGYTRARTPGGDGYMIDPDTAPVIAELYDRYVSGEGLRQLVRWLERQGVVSPRTGRPWTNRGVGYLLQSGWAAGLLYSAKNGTWEPGAHPPIITTRVWDAYLAEHARRQRTYPRLLNPTTMLSGLVYCGHCGCRCRLRSDRRYGTGYLFACGVPCQGAPSIVRRKAETAVADWLAEHAADRQVRDGTTAADKAARVAWKAEQSTLRREAQNLDVQLSRLTREMAAGRVPAGAYETVRDELLEAQEDATGRLRELAVMLGRPRPSAAQFARVLDVWDGMDIAGRQAALATVIGRVEVVRADGRVEARVVGVWEAGG